MIYKSEKYEIVIKINIQKMYQIEKYRKLVTIILNLRIDCPGVKTEASVI